MAASVATTTQTGSKRKASVAGLPGSVRPVKRRASKACHCCRSRKVRCDVVESGIPCTNCRLDEVECLVTEGKRRKKSYVEGNTLNLAPIESIEEKDEIPKFPLFDDIDGLQDLALPDRQTSHEACGVPSFDMDSNSHRPHLIYQTAGQRMSPQERTRRMTALGPTPNLSITPVPLPPHLQYSSPVSQRPTVVLPPYIASIPGHVLLEDLEYLQKKGAFELPDPSLRNELLRSYAQHVHPYLPILDLEDFLFAIDSNQSDNSISLLLYHAVMFAASAYIDMRHLTAQGYANRKVARKAYFQRVKLLYDFDWELERVAVVQSVLLMTFWYESPNDPKDVWYWLGIAISIARTIGMNYTTEGTSILNPQKQKLWKRIWWSIYVRDRILAIGLRRPIRVRAEDYDVPMLKLEDFETNPLPTKLCKMLGGCSAVRDGSKRETLAKLCIAMVTLCRLMTDVLEIQYSTLGHKIGITSETTVRLVPKPSGAEISEVFRCDNELQEWYNSLSDDIRYFKADSRDRTSNHDGEVICVHRALLTSIYYTTSGALHRPQMMPSMPDQVIPPELRALSQKRVRDGALGTTEIYRDLYAHDLIRYLPNTGVTVLLPAIILHLMDIKSSEGDEKQNSMRQFQFCMQALQKLRDLYSSADCAFAFLDAAIKKADPGEKGTGNSGIDSIKIFLKTDVNHSTLTPPPEVLSGADNYVDQSTLSHADRGSFNAMTPPSPARTSALCTNSGVSLSLKDLEHFIGLDQTQHDDSHLAMLISSTIEDATAMDDNQNTPFFGNTPAAPISLPSNEYAHLTNTDNGSDLFAPNQVNIDDNLFKDIDMEWLADSNDDDNDDDSYNTNDLLSPHDLTTKHVDDTRINEQLITPPNSATPSSREESQGTPQSQAAREGSAQNDISPDKLTPETKMKTGPATAVHVQAEPTTVAT